MLWFVEKDTTPAALRATTAALALQAIMTALPQKLGLKISVTSGATRRFVVGDSDIQLLDALVDATIARLAAAEHLAVRGETLVDTATAEALAESVSVSEWRTAGNGERFAVVKDIAAASPPITLDMPASLEINGLRSWILPVVFEREQSGNGAFLTELRPAVALFLRFTDIEYDEDEQAGDKLNVNLIF